jgi:hypothetical protein
MVLQSRSTLQRQLVSRHRQRRSHRLRQRARRPRVQPPLASLRHRQRRSHHLHLLQVCSVLPCSALQQPRVSHHRQRRSHRLPRVLGSTHLLPLLASHRRQRRSHRLPRVLLVSTHLLLALLHHHRQRRNHHRLPRVQLRASSHLPLASLRHRQRRSRRLLLAPESLHLPPLASHHHQRRNHHHLRQVQV